MSGSSITAYVPGFGYDFFVSYAHVDPDDLKFIAYTLISNGFRIQYIGRVERARDTIQIGGRPRSLAAPFWTVEQVSGLQKLPIDNERNTK